MSTVEPMVKQICHCLSIEPKPLIPESLDHHISGKVPYPRKSEGDSCLSCWFNFYESEIKSYFKIVVFCLKSWTELSRENANLYIIINLKQKVCIPKFYRKYKPLLREGIKTP